MGNFMRGHFIRARQEGRLCERCGWMISKKRWEKGERMCGECQDALRGVNVNRGNSPYQDEPPDLTGEAI